MKLSWSGGDGVGSGESGHKVGVRRIRVGVVRSCSQKGWVGRGFGVR